MLINGCDIRIIHATTGEIIRELILNPAVDYQPRGVRKPRKYPKYSPEFREEAARMVVEGSRAIAQVAREYGLSETTLGNWVRAYRETHASD